METAPAKTQRIRCEDHPRLPLLGFCDHAQELADLLFYLHERRLGNVSRRARQRADDPPATFEQAGEWMRLASSITHTDVDPGRFDSSDGFCGPAWDYARSAG